MKKLALCISNINIPKILKINVNSVYNCSISSDKTIIVDSINDKNKRVILNHEEFEKCFIPIISIDEAIDIFTNKLYGINIRKTKRVTGCIIHETYHESYEYYIKFQYYPETMIMIKEREVYIDASDIINNRECFCCDLVATIHSNLKKIDGLSFVANLIPSEIEDLIKTLEFLCKEDMRYGSEQV